MPTSNTTLFRKQTFDYAKRVGRPFDVARGGALIQPGASSSPLFIILEGAAHAYIDKDASRQTLRLGYPGELLSALPALFLGVPTPIGIEAIRRCRGFSILRSQLLDLIHSAPEHQRAYIEMLEGFACGLMERELDLLEPSPQQRYETVLRRSPQVFQEVPLRYIASYLRMSPETLSRVRRASRGSMLPGGGAVAKP